MQLSGISVLDLAGLLPGAYCTQLLRQQGADVLKVEPPSGDAMRKLPGGETLFKALHSGKRLRTIDLQSREGRTAFLELAAAADVLVEGFRPGVMERLSLGYQALARINPRLVYCAITGYGSDGPLASRAGHDLNYLARSGALSLMPLANGVPVIPGLTVADLAGGLQAAFLVATALVERPHGGRGSRVEVSMTGLMASWTLLPREARRAGRPGLGLSGEVPCYHVYAVTDGFITVAALESKFWARLCHAIDRDDLVPRQFDPAAIAELQAIFGSASRSDWVERFANQDVCVEPVLTLEESEAS